MAKRAVHSRFSTAFLHSMDNPPLGNTQLRRVKSNIPLGEITNPNPWSRAPNERDLHFLLHAERSWSDFTRWCDRKRPKTWSGLLWLKSRRGQEEMTTRQTASVEALVNHPTCGNEMIRKSKGAPWLMPNSAKGVRKNKKNRWLGRSLPIVSSSDGRRGCEYGPKSVSFPSFTSIRQQFCTH